MATDSIEASNDLIPDGPIILVVDDDDRTTRLERFVLEEEGYSVIRAGSGEEALEMLDTSSPALILLDIMLPKMDGFATCQKIRETSQVPIIMLTGEGRDEEKIRGLEMGADDYITKPFSVYELTARVKAVLRRSNYRQPQSVAAHAGAPQPETPSIEEREDQYREERRERKEIISIESKEVFEKSHSQEEEQPKDEFYEGAVKLIVETTGAIKDMVDFVDALREHPQFHLLRMVSNARRDGMDVWLRLREPNPLRTTLMAAKGVTKVDAVDSAELDPETGAETRVLKISLT